MLGCPDRVYCGEKIHSNVRSPLHILSAINVAGDSGGGNGVCVRMQGAAAAGAVPAGESGGRPGLPHRHPLEHRELSQHLCGGVFGAVPGLANCAVPAHYQQPVGNPVLQGD